MASPSTSRMLPSLSRWIVSAVLRVQAAFFSIQVEHENSEDLAFVFALPSAYEWF